jgi:hypothetical protein
MDVNTVGQLVGSLGFPIVACIALYLQINKSNETHKQEMDKLTEAVNNNTIAITKLITKIEGDKSGN